MSPLPKRGAGRMPAMMAPLSITSQAGLGCSPMVTRLRAGLNMVSEGCESSFCYAMPGIEGRDSAGAKFPSCGAKQHLPQTAGLAYRRVRPFRGIT